MAAAKAKAFFEYLTKKGSIQGTYVTNKGKKQWKFDGTGRITFKVSGNVIQKKGVNWLKKTGDNAFTYMDPNGGKIEGIKVTGWNAATKIVTFDKAIKMNKNTAKAAATKKRNAEVAANKVAREAREAQRREKFAKKAQKKQKEAEARQKEATRNKNNIEWINKANQLMERLGMDTAQPGYKSLQKIFQFALEKKFDPDQDQYKDKKVRDKAIKKYLNGNFKQQINNQKERDKKKGWGVTGRSIAETIRTITTVKEDVKLRF